jgi:hypothetical protein
VRRPGLPRLVLILEIEGGRPKVQLEASSREDEEALAAWLEHVDPDVLVEALRRALRDLKGNL